MISNIPIIDNLIKSLSLIKILFLFLNFGLIVFLLVVFIQVVAMERVIREIHDSVKLRAVALLILLISISLFFTALVIL